MSLVSCQSAKVSLLLGFGWLSAGATEATELRGSRVVS